jgi:hypothetical protein
MSCLQMCAQSRVCVTVVIGRGRHAAEAARVRRGSLEGDTRRALREWIGESDDRHGEHFGSELGRSLCARLWFDSETSLSATLAELDAALGERLLERLETRVSEPPRDRAVAAGVNN